MEDAHRILCTLALIVVLGVGGQWLAWAVRLPSVLVLLALGMLSGAGFQWLDPDQTFGTVLQPAVSLAVGFILFEGGLSLKLTELKAVWKSLLGLLTIGVVATWLAAAWGAVSLLPISTSTALVMGALLTVTGPTVIGPLLREIRPSGNVGLVARWEGITIDPVGAILAVLVFEFTEDFRQAELDTALTDALTGLAATAAGGCLTGILCGWSLAAVLRRYWVPDHLRNPVALLMTTVAFAAAESLHHEAGLIAVTLMGVWLANQKDLDLHGISEFKESVTVLLISGLFILLTARLPASALTTLGVRGVLFAGFIILIVRPTAVLLSTWNSGLSLNERLFLCWFAPRGIVAAAVSSVFALRMGAEG
ncbi:MAG: cation:proton antiporter, partial [Planctomycetaceae bacterium]|nr:cation:proton antiporter [Planctomycetaceae bacterium]